MKGCGQSLRRDATAGASLSPISPFDSSAPNNGEGRIGRCGELGYEKGARVYLRITKPLPCLRLRSILLRKCSDDKELKYKRRGNVRGFPSFLPKPQYTFNFKWSSDEGGRGSDIEEELELLQTSENFNENGVAREIDRSEDNCTRRTGRTGVFVL